MGKFWAVLCHFTIYTFCMVSNIIARLLLNMQNVQIMKLHRTGQNFPIGFILHLPRYWICLHISMCYNRNLWQPSFLLYLVTSNTLASAAPLVPNTFGYYQMPQ